MVRWIFWPMSHRSRYADSCIWPRVEVCRSAPCLTCTTRRQISSTALSQPMPILGQKTLEKVPRKITHSLAGRAFIGGTASPSKRTSA